MSDHSDDMECRSWEAEERSARVRRGRRDRIYPSGKVAGMDEFMEYEIYDLRLDDFDEMMRGQYQMMFDAVEQSLKKGVWVARDGRETKIEDMDSSHLSNTIRFLKRNESWPFSNIYIEKMEAELERRGNPPAGWKPKKRRWWQKKRPSDKFAFLRGWPE